MTDARRLPDAVGLASNLSPDEMAGHLSGLWRTIERHGDPGLAGLMVQSVDTMLDLRDYPVRLMKGGAKTYGRSGGQIPAGHGRAGQEG